MKRILPFTILILTLFLAGCPKAESKDTGEQEEQNIKAAPVTEQVVETVIASIQIISDTLRSSGTTAPLKEVMLTAKSSGTITSVKTAFGEEVKKGQLLLAVESDVQLAMVNQAKAALEEATLHYEAIEKLYNKGSVSKAEFLSAKSGLSSAKMNLTAQRYQYNNCFHYAPFAGSITFFDKNSEKGALIGAGTPFASLVDISKLKVTIFVSEQEIPLLKKEQPLTLFINALGKSVTGTITALSESSSPATGAFAVEIQFENKKKEIKAGMSVTTSMPLGNSREEIVIPSNAITTFEGERGIFVVDDGKALFRKVAIKQLWGDEVIVTSGINVGEKVVITGVSLLAHNAPVKVAKL